MNMILIIIYPQVVKHLPIIQTIRKMFIIRLVPAQDGPFSTRALIWVHFKTVRYFHQPIFSLFSDLKNALHNLVIELCSAPFFSKILYRYLLTSRTVL